MTVVRIVKLLLLLLKLVTVVLQLLASLRDVVELFVKVLLLLYLFLDALLHRVDLHFQSINLLLDWSQVLSQLLLGLVLLRYLGIDDVFPLEIWL